MNYSSKDLLFFHTGDGRRMTAKSKTKDLSFETQTCPAGWTVQVGHAVVLPESRAHTSARQQKQTAVHGQRLTTARPSSVLKHTLFRTFGKKTARSR